MKSEQSPSIGASLLPEWHQEMLTTRRVIERVPSDKGEWRPHPKSFPLGHLTQLVATMPGWITRMVDNDHIDLAAGGGYSYETTETLLAQFDRLVPEARAALESVSDADMAAPWSLRMGDKVLLTMPRGDNIRQTINHIVHHRGQLTVYLRLLDVPVPQVYGPTADEGWG
ncbi:MAG TPA: DinB family protein [Longimicrobiales bacterium]|nr:DinB family protein [Longimicrobiales bacterium]